MKYQLPKKFAEKWVRALRGGKYKQGKNQLRSCRGKYCCLGVACKLVGLPAREFEDATFISINGVGSLISMPKEIPIELIGYPSNNDLVAELSRLNDSHGKSFSQIADWIEQNVEFI